jgi:hypothetical protein
MCSWSEFTIMLGARFVIEGKPELQMQRKLLIDFLFFLLPAADFNVAFCFASSFEQH